MKKFRYLILSLGFFLCSTQLVLASSFDVSITSNSVTVGNTVTLSISASDAVGRLYISSSDISVASVSDSSVWVENNRVSVTISAKKVGSAVITIRDDDNNLLSNSAGQDINLAPKSITLTVKAKPVVSNNTNNNGNSNVVTPKAKSNDNFLTSLTIDGLKLDSDFDKEKLEYSVTVPADYEKIKINAQLSNSKAKVVGVGEFPVLTGANKFSIEVTAEDGSKRTYIINANVLELEPINIILEGNEYKLIRNKEKLPKISEYYKEKEITIGEDKIFGYYNETLDYTLVALEDSNGSIDYYIYKNGKYTLYKEYTFNGVTLQMLNKEIGNNYKSTTFNYDKDKINAYQEVKVDLVKNTYALDSDDVIGNQFYLFYAKNIATGREGIYQYDALEGTVQRYNVELLDMYKNHNNTYYLYLLGSILVIGFLIVLFSIVSISATKRNGKVKPKRKVEEDDF